MLMPRMAEWADLMLNAKNMIARFIADEDGSPAIEYSLMAAGIAMACILAFTALGNGVENLFGAGSDGAGPTLEAAATAAGS